jgi:hypothetical protein
VKNDSLEMPAGEEGVVIGTQRFSRRMHMPTSRRSAQEGHRQYEKEMNLRAIAIFKQMIARSTRSPASRWLTRHAPEGRPERNPGRRHRADRDFSIDWVKGSQEAKRAGENTYRRFWPRVQAVLKEKTAAWST